MMTSSQEQIQKLLEARNAAYGDGFRALDIDHVSVWQSKDIVFNDIAMNEYNMNHKSFKTFMGTGFKSMKRLKIIEDKTTGTLDFTAWEQLIELEYGVDEPKMGIKAGQKGFVRGVSLQWWEWKGEGSWDGDLSPRAIRDWKIVREHDYMVALKEGNTGGEERLF